MLKLHLLMCDRFLVGAFVDLWLIFVDQIQAIEDRGRRCAEHSAEGDYYSARFEPDPSA
jgi:hypothetical protein